MPKHYPKGLDNRMRDENGRIRAKDGDTLIKTLEKKYDVDFGVRGDMKLENFLDKEGYKSLTQALKDLYFPHFFRHQPC